MIGLRSSSQSVVGFRGAVPDNMSEEAFGGGMLGLMDFQSPSRESFHQTSLSRNLLDFHPSAEPLQRRA
jgi:hypothetical protein